ncbi:unnamed protein product [Amaranthus hypochondriacus]
MMSGSSEDGYDDHRDGTGSYWLSADISDSESSSSFSLLRLMVMLMLMLMFLLLLLLLLLFFNVKMLETLIF